VGGGGCAVNTSFWPVYDENRASSIVEREERDPDLLVLPSINNRLGNNLFHMRSAGQHFKMGASAAVQHSIHNVTCFRHRN
jgi:hypothetical protein